MGSPSPDAARASLGPRLPFQLGRLTLCKEIGAGGMATVFLGRMQLGSDLDRLVAAKTIHPHLAKETHFVEMFLDEARIASQINHPNCCAVYDFGDVDGIYYMAMEYLVGEPLIDVINQIVDKRDQALLEALPFLAARIMADACEGLHAAHTLRGTSGRLLQVVHRDVSPQNLFVTYDGSVKVVDFGCAKALERVTQTNTGIMKGKVSYAAPEQLKAQDVDARADVFALGICLWECLTLQQLFRRETAMKTAMAVLQDPIPRADRRASWVPRQLADIAARALSRDREQRYGSAREMGRDLRAFIAQSGAPFESAELAEWMEYLFSNRHQQQLSLVSEVEKLDLDSVAPLSLQDEVSSVAPRALTAEDSTESRPRELAIHASDSIPVGRARRRKPWAGLAMFLAFLAVGAGAAFYLAQRQQDSDQPIQSTVRVEVPESAVEVRANDPEPVAEPAAPEPIAVEADVTEDDDSASPSMASQAARMTARRAMIRAPALSDEQGMRVRPAALPEREAEGDVHDDALAAEVPTEGTVQIRAEAGWADISYEGRIMGRTPCRISLPGGSHTIRILPFGHRPGSTVTVTVHPGTHQSLTLHVSEETTGSPQMAPAAMTESATTESNSDRWEPPF